MGWWKRRKVYSNENCSLNRTDLCWRFAQPSREQRGQSELIDKLIMRKLQVVG